MASDFMTVKHLGFYPAVAHHAAPRPAWAGDKTLVFSFLLSVAVHALALVAVSWYMRPDPGRIFILVEAGEEAVELELGAAFTSPPLPRREIAEKRFSEQRDRLPPADEPDRPATAFAVVAIPESDALFMVPAPERLEPMEKALEATARQPNRENRNEPETVRPSALASPAPPSPAMVEGADRRPRGSRQRARPNGRLVPHYPTSSRRRGESGVVVVRVLIDAAGRPGSARVERSSGYPALDRAAMDTVARATFQPARIDGRAVAMEERFQLEFRLR